MLKQVILLTALIGALTGCTYGHMHYSPSYEQEATMRADSRRVQADERAERAERRRERRQEMMDEADAINRANRNNRIYILH